jgi:hypothetical protein
MRVEVVIANRSFNLIPAERVPTLQNISGGWLDPIEKRET